MILLGSISHALTWVLVELLLKGSVHKHADDPMRPEAVSLTLTPTLTLTLMLTLPVSLTLTLTLTLPLALPQP